MGKDSLTKSTSKKKSTGTKKVADKKQKNTKPKKATTAKKPTAKNTKKPAAVKTTPKAQSAKRPKKQPQKSASDAPKKTMPSRKELIFKKFDKQAPAKRYTPPKPSAVPVTPAPPFYTGRDEADTKRVRALLFNNYSMADVRAAAEKTVTDKTAADKKYREEKPAAINVTPPKTRRRELDSVEKSMLAAIAVVVFLFLLIIGASISNTRKFYIHEKDGGIEILQGRFSPLGEELLISLPGVDASENQQDVYTKKEVFPLIFNHYVDKADTLLNIPGMPDFEGIKRYLETAITYAITTELRAAATIRSNTIDQLILMYKADVAFSRNTIDDLENGLQHLEKAKKLTTDKAQVSLINSKIAAGKERLTALRKEADETAAAEAAVEESKKGQAEEATEQPEQAPTD
ncbi:MAG: hypothetical protein HKM93_10155 [Desulfobacteraceae bacterium]|nr:hypothetical protein [Desulfobacteraceae bacterium]